MIVRQSKLIIGKTPRRFFCLFFKLSEGRGFAA
jgi:hypothetical protein